MRRTLRPLLTAFVTAVLAATAGLALAQDVTILHTNDVYEIEPVDDGARGGAARVATLFGERAGLDPLILFSGDLFSPSLMSTVFYGSQMVDVYNRLGTDAAVYGNHEFDFGPEVAAERVAESEFPWLATNLLDDTTGEPLAGAQRLALFERNGVTVGVMGLVGNWFDLTTVGPNAVYVDFVEAGRAAVAELEAQGAEVIVAITHMYLAEDELLAREVPEIDLVLGGHDHEPIVTVAGDTLVWKTGSDFRTVGELSVYALRTVEPLVIPRFLTVDAAVAEDPEMKAVVDGYVATLDEELGEPIGEAAVALDARRATVRFEESNFGNLIADAMREYAGADLAIANGGGIRSDAVYGPGTLARRDVMSVLPFGNVVVSLRLSGAEVLEALENSVSQYEDGAGRFPQLSGATIRVDPSRPAGERVVEATVGGAPLDRAATYVVATNDYAAGGGDGFEVFVDAPRIIDASGGRLLASVVMDYIDRNAPVAPQVEGRIVIE